MKDQTGSGKEAKPTVKPDRAVREATALRANLLKRKDQARKREEVQRGRDDDAKT